MSPEEFREELKTLKSNIYMLGQDGPWKVGEYGENLYSFSENFKEVYDSSKDLKEYWEFCPYDIWLKLVENKKKDYLKKYSFSRDDDYYREWLKFFLENKFDDDKKNSGDLVFKTVITGFSHQGLEEKTYLINLRETLPEDFYKKIFYQERAKKEFLEANIKKDVISDNLNLRDYSNDKTIPYGNGDKLNFKERFYILEQIGAIDKLIMSYGKVEGRKRILNIFLGCSKNTAKDLLNHKEPINSDRIKELDKYVQTIKKDDL